MATTAYKIVTGNFQSSNAHLDIEKLVNQAIQEGWTPLGGVHFLQNNSFAQAMVKESAK